MTGKETKILAQLVIVLVVMGTSSLAQAVSNITVNLRLNDTQTQLEATTNGRCAKTNHEGCIRVKKRRTARFNFVLKGDRKCTSPGGDRWNLGGVYLGGKGSEQKPVNWGNLDAEVQADFSVADVVTGLLNKESGSNDSKIVIFDNNKHKYDIWYTVTANCIDMSGNVITTIEMDPRIENDGTTQ